MDTCTDTDARLASAAQPLPPLFVLGDRVRIARKVKQYAGWNCWTWSMDSTLGLEGDVTYVTSAGDVDVCLSNGDTWAYPAAALDFLDESRTAIRCLRTDLPISVGDLDAGATAE